VASAPLIREPRVAGSFYPRTKAALDAELDRCYAEAAHALIPLERRDAIGAVGPHAGFVYSGAVAAKVYARMTLPETVIVISPNHTGLGPRMSIWPSGRWVVPTGTIEVDEALSLAIRAGCPGLEADTRAHEREHGIETHVPFILRERPDARLVAIVLGTQDPDRARRLGEAIPRALAATGRRAVIVASSDMNHFDDQATTLAKDRRALDRVVARDPAGLLETCARDGITMCGAAPTAAMLWAGAALGAREAVLVDHRTSGDVSGDLESVVGYAGVLLRC